jgi:hypothetical protein
MSKLAIALTVVVGIAALAVLSMTEFGRADMPKDSKVQSEDRRKVCVFLESPEVIDGSEELSKAFAERMKRESRGYETDIPLAEALRIFNAELKCYSYWASLPPVTEEEIVANAIGGPDYGNEPKWQLQKQVLDQISTRKIMPKGALLVAESGGCQTLAPPGPQTCVRGLKIYLFFGLDKVPREEAKPEQIVLIRKTYFDVFTQE